MSTPNNSGPYERPYVPPMGAGAANSGAQGSGDDMSWDNTVIAGPSHPYGGAVRQASQGQTPQQTPHGQSPQYAPLPGMPGAQPPAQKGKNSKVKWIALVAGVVVVAAASVGGFLVVNNVNQSNHGPDVVVQEYVDALARGDISAAMEVGNFEIEKGVSRALLTNKVYKEVKDKPSDLSITNTEIKGDSATVTISYKLGKGEDKFSQKFSLKMTGKESVFFDVWEIDAGKFPTQMTVTVNQTQGALTVAGADVSESIAEGDENINVTLPAFPGTYTVEYSDSADVFGVTTGEVVVKPGEKGSAVALETTITEGVQTEVNDQVQATVNAWVDQCVASNFLGETCGAMANQFGNEIVQNQYHIVRFEVVQYPFVTSGVSDAGDWTYSTHDGQMAFVGLERDTENESKVPVAIDYRGTLTVDENFKVSEVTR